MKTNRLRNIAASIMAILLVSSTSFAGAFIKLQNSRPEAPAANSNNENKNQNPPADSNANNDASKNQSGHETQVSPAPTPDN